MLAEGGALEIERRRKFELQDLYLDALRSRTGAPPGASIAPFLLGMAMLVGAGAVLGLDIHLHLELKTVLLIQLATAPFLALVLLAMIAAAATFVLRKYRVR
jgi:hypothetical protein